MSDKHRFSSENLLCCGSCLRDGGRWLAAAKQEQQRRRGFRWPVASSRVLMVSFLMSWPMRWQGILLLWVPTYKEMTVERVGRGTAAVGITVEQPH